jgi:hypothetical protein
MFPHSHRLRGTSGDMLSQDATLTTSKLSKNIADELLSPKTLALVPVTIYRPGNSHHLVPSNEAV